MSQQSKIMVAGEDALRNSDLQALFRSLRVVHGPVTSSPEQPVLVNADSLLLTVARQRWNAGAQEATPALLPALHSAERLLQQLTDGGRHVRVVFFRALEATYASHPWLAYLRHALKGLLVALPVSRGVAVDEFESWWSPEYRRTLETTLSAFVVVHDCDAEAFFNSKPAELGRLEHSDAAHRHLVLSTLLGNNTMGFTLPCVRLEELDCRSAEAEGVSYEFPARLPASLALFSAKSGGVAASPAVAEDAEPITPEEAEAEEKQARQVAAEDDVNPAVLEVALDMHRPELQPVDLQLPVAEDQKLLEELVEASGGDSRLALTAWALGKVAAAADDLQLDTARVVLLQAALLPALGLSGRGQVVPAVSQPRLAALQPLGVKLLAAAAPGMQFLVQKDGSASRRAQLADLIDLGLCQKLLLAVGEKPVNKLAELGGGAKLQAAVELAEKLWSKTLAKQAFLPLGAELSKVAAVAAVESAAMAHAKEGLRELVAMVESDPLQTAFELITSPPLLAEAEKRKEQARVNAEQHKQQQQQAATAATDTQDAGTEDAEDEDWEDGGDWEAEMEEEEAAVAEAAEAELIARKQAEERAAEEAHAAATDPELLLAQRFPLERGETEAWERHYLSHAPIPDSEPAAEVDPRQQQRLQAHLKKQSESLSPVLVRLRDVAIRSNPDDEPVDLEALSNERLASDSSSGSGGSSSGSSGGSRQGKGSSKHKSAAESSDNVQGDWWVGQKADRVRSLLRRKLGAVAEVVSEIRSIKRQASSLVLYFSRPEWQDSEAGDDKGSKGGKRSGKGGKSSAAVGGKTSLLSLARNDSSFLDLLTIFLGIAERSHFPVCQLKTTEIIRRFFPSKGSEPDLPMDRKQLITSYKAVVRLSKVVERTEESVGRLIKVASVRPTLEQRIFQLDDDLSRESLELAKQNTELWAIPAFLQLVQWCAESWNSLKHAAAQYRLSGQADEFEIASQLEPAVRLYHITTSIFRRFKQYLTPPQLRVLLETLWSLGCSEFETSARAMCQEYLRAAEEDPFAACHGQNLTMDAVWVADPKLPGGLQMSYVDFQLRHAGHVLVRDVNSQPDRRVPFYPDGWQVQLLDTVDEGRSALLVAPTSSGKTFISYYCLKRVLSANMLPGSGSGSGGVSLRRNTVLYVAPIKSLINQAKADLHLRYPDATISRWTSSVGEAPLADPEDTDILLTIPELLETVLLSPHWAPFVAKLRYAILDEIHCMGMDDGELWERALVMLPCPLIALSATLANKEQLAGWLNRVHQSQLDRWLALEQEDRQMVAARQVVQGSDKKGSSNSSSKSTLETASADEAGANLIALGARLGDGLRQQRAVELIIHTDRWSHLDAYTYAPAGDAEVAQGGLEQALVAGQRRLNANLPASGRSSVTLIHPLVAMRRTLEQFQQQQQTAQEQKEEASLIEGRTKSAGAQITQELLEGLALSPSDCIALYHVLAELAGPSQMLPQLGELNPSQFFGARPVVMKNDVKRWEGALKGQLAQLAQKDGPLVDRVIDRLGENLAHLSQESKDQANSVATTDSQGGMQFLLRNFLDMLKQLEVRDFLPAIVFAGTRYQVEALLNHTVNEFERLEFQDRVQCMFERDGTRRTPVAAAEARTRRTQRRRDLEDSLKALNGELTRLRSQLENYKRGREPQQLLLDIQKLKEQIASTERELSPPVDPRFTVGRAGGLNVDDEGDYWVDRLLKRTRWRKDHWLLRGLRRGIAIHHGGCVEAYRALVEVAFRQGKIRVVITDYKTLTYGVNMPCRTSVFAGDSVSLTSLLYQQCSGRAGRRGYDYRGQAVFYGVRLLKSSTLIASGLPNLHSYFYVNPSLLLRMAAHTFDLNRSDDRDWLAVPAGSRDALSKSISRLLLRPYFGGWDALRGKATGAGAARLLDDSKEPEELVDNADDPEELEVDRRKLELVRSFGCFSLQFLLRLGLLAAVRSVTVTGQGTTAFPGSDVDKDDVEEVKNPDGHVFLLPTGPGRLVAHLHDHEPGSFYFTELLRSGVFEELCAEIDSGSKDPKAVQRRLDDAAGKVLAVLSHLFLRSPLPVATDEDPNKAAAIVLADGQHEAAAGVYAVLDPLHQEDSPQLQVSARLRRTLLASLNRVNQLALRHGIAYHGRAIRNAELRAEGAAATVSESWFFGPEFAQAQQTPTTPAPAVDQVPVLEQLLAGATDIVRSPAFPGAAPPSSLQELREVAQGSAAPTLALPGQFPTLVREDRLGRVIPVNALALNFFLNATDRSEANYQLMMSANQIPRGQVWHRLHLWDTLLARLSRALRILSRSEESAGDQPSASPRVIKVFAHLATAFEQRFEKLEGGDIQDDQKRRRRPIWRPKVGKMVQARLPDGRWFAGLLLAVIENEKNPLQPQYRVKLVQLMRDNVLLLNPVDVRRPSRGRL